MVREHTTSTAGGVGWRTHDVVPQEATANISLDEEMLLPSNNDYVLLVWNGRIELLRYPDRSLFLPCWLFAHRDETKPPSRDPTDEGRRGTSPSSRSESQRREHLARGTRRRAPRLWIYDGREAMGEHVRGHTSTPEDI
jgi:hypothetical protein